MPTIDNVRPPDAGELRRLRLKMASQSLTLRLVSRKAEIPYTSASSILRGRLIAPGYLEKLRQVIESAPVNTDVNMTPEEFRAAMRTEVRDYSPKTTISIAKFFKRVGKPRRLTTGPNEL